MNILFLQDYNFLTGQGGGAELSDGIIFAYGMEIGHNITLATPQTRLDDVESFDLTVVSNCTTFKEEQLLSIMKRSKKVLYYAHDFWDVCKWRLYKNNRENCRTHCPRLPFAKKFWEEVDGAVWLSDKHRESYLFSYPELIHKPNILMPSPIDVSNFLDPELEKVERIPNTVIGNNILPFKGAKNILQYCQTHRNYQFTFIGAEPENAGAFPSNVQFIGRIDNKDIPKLLRSFHFAIALPSTVQPYERFPVEAVLSGCIPIVNENVGCASYEWFGDYDKTRHNSIVSPKFFWKFAEGI